MRNYSLVIRTRCLEANFVSHSNEVSFVGTGEILKMMTLILLLMLLCGYHASDHMRE